MTRRSDYNSWSILSIFLVSAAVISLQLVLIRTLSAVHYYHFTYLVISTALLGFGASGTLLALFYERLKSKFHFWNLLFLLLFLASIPITYFSAQSLSLDTQYVLYSRQQLFLLIMYILLMLIPFLLGGLIIGFMLTYFRREMPVLYGANLIGSGAGGIMALAIMYLVSPYQLPFMITPLALLAMTAFFISAPGYRSGKFVSPGGILMGLGFLITLLSVTAEPQDSVDPYKALSHFRQLEQQSDASRKAERHGPQALIDIYESHTFHYTLFAGPQATVMPPEQLAILLDGTITGSLLSIEDSDQAAILDFTPQSLPYRLLDTPRVLLLGEVGSVNIWLARRMGAEKITVVQNNPQLIDLIKDDLADSGGHIYRDDMVEIINKNPRLYIEQSTEQYDLIQLVAGEAITSGTGGLQGLNEDYLLTKESIARALDIVSPEGLISITRGIQSPPRDNLKIISMFNDAANYSGISNPAGHMLISRNYLAANTLLSRSPPDDQKIETFISEARQLQLDLEYYPGIRTGEIEQINLIEGPEGENYSYIHYAVNQILSEDPDPFFRNWVYNVQTPVDDSPYFHDFFTWSSLDTFIESYGDQWFQRLELGYILLIITFLELVIIAFLLILLPLIFRREQYLSAGNKMPTLLHFYMIGTGFMFLEITFIQTFTKFLGDPIFSAAAVICSILIFSGTGSIVQKLLPYNPLQRIRIATAAIAGLTLLYLLLIDPLLNLFITMDTISRFTVTVLILMPISFFLGWMFPGGMDILEKNSDGLIPWAWGINGFASVIAAPLAIILSMSIGFSGVILAGLGFYVIAGATSWLWQVKSPS